MENNLNLLAQKPDNRRPLMANLSRTLYNAVLGNFDAEGRPKWQSRQSSEGDRGHKLLQAKSPLRFG